MGNSWAPFKELQCIKRSSDASNAARCRTTEAPTAAPVTMATQPCMRTVDDPKSVHKQRKHQLITHQPARWLQCRKMVAAPIILASNTWPMYQHQSFCPLIHRQLNHAAICQDMLHTGSHALQRRLRHSKSGTQYKEIAKPRHRPSKTRNWSFCTTNYA